MSTSSRLFAQLYANVLRDLLAEVMAPERPDAIEGECTVIVDAPRRPGDTVVSIQKRGAEDSVNDAASERE